MVPSRAADPYEIGDVVVYPHHGAGRVVGKALRDTFGGPRECLTIAILHSAMVVTVPTESADRAGIRRAIDGEGLEEVLAALGAEASWMPASWSRRLRHNNAKIRTGDAVELAEVVRNLAIRSVGRQLSLKDQQMLVRAKRILVSELMYARGIGAEEAAAFLEALLDADRAEEVALPA